ncbi:MAG: hypothetical protein EPO52_15280 [Herbiconiux sp.]|uniref:DUF6349 family protein n=1 Tax=Microbacteriaceae TaxID=85023 RepID=UPI00121973FE|nr:DUF6349 family protein [Herbiconiux sp.]TAJ46890.1 MAG: hypothetical protein EPO52_15280 [Herbiconiux sp.]
MPIDGQLSFDIDELIREDLRANAPEWQGAPLYFTTDYYSPSELDAAFQHWKVLYGNFGCIPLSHMWHRGFSGISDRLTFQEHSIAMFTADLRAEPEAEGPGDLIYQAVCEPCDWHHVSGTENGAVEGWHDHAVPGWRELPVIPAQVRVREQSSLTKLGRRWIEAHYPPEMQVPGAPMITERARYATRHVAGHSPWGGYDLSSTALGQPASDDNAVARSSPKLLSAPTAQPAVSPGAQVLRR